MPWTGQGGGGGGPWKPGNQGPWGQGPSGPQTPPDLEELLRRGQDKLKQIMPGGSGSAIVTGRGCGAADRMVLANRETIEGCSKAAARTRETVRCTIKVGGNHQ